MSIMVCDGVSLSYGTKEILKNVSFSVNEGVKLGIIGINGAGKSTLANIITGRIQPTSGKVYIPSNVTVGMLSQRNDDSYTNKTVYDIAVSAFSHLVEQETLLEKLASRIAESPSAASEYEKQRHDFEIKGGNEYKTKVKSMLARFGFGKDMWDFDADALSGGQKTRLALASLLISGKDIIILDEPTNHLDVDTVEWLEGFISSSSKTYVIISHDRYFLDKVTNETVEIEHLTATKYTGSYSAFKEKKKQLAEIAEKHYEQQQKEQKKLESFIQTQIELGQKRNLIAIKSRLKLASHNELMDKPKAQPKNVKISIHTTSSSFSVLSVRGLSKAFGGNRLFGNLSFDITKGEKVMIIGANGCGKSTLLKIINGITDADSGICELGYSQVVGYYDQEVQLLNEGNTVIDELIEADRELTPPKARSVLGAYGFSGEDAFKQVSILSGGERARLSIAKLVLKKVSFLILDEPTNHLDIPSKESLEKALSEYEGTVLAVSHDRYFINSLGTRIIEIDKDGYAGGYNDFKGDYEHFLQKRIKLERIQEESKDKASKSDFAKSKKEKGAKRAKEKRIEFLSSAINELEQRIKNLEEDSVKLSTDYVKLSEIDGEMASVKELLDKYYDEYLILDEDSE